MAPLADSLDALGRGNQVMDAAIAPLAIGARASGRAATAQFAPVAHDTDESCDTAIEVIDGRAAGTVVVIASERSTRSALAEHRVL